jgi:hypothetical protein
MEGMTLDQAMTCMQNGAKVCEDNWESKEYIYYNENNQEILDENNQEVFAITLFANRDGLWFVWQK